MSQNPFLAPEVPNATTTMCSDGLPRQERATWYVHASADNAAATATKAAGGAAVSHYVCGIAAVFDNTAANKLLQLKDGSTVIATFVVTSTTHQVIQFTTPIKVTANAAVNLVLNASGTGGTSGYAAVWGYSI